MFKKLSFLKMMAATHLQKAGTGQQKVGKASGTNTEELKLIRLIVKESVK